MSTESPGDPAPTVHAARDQVLVAPFATLLLVREAIEVHGA